MALSRYLDRYETAHLHAPTAFVIDCVGELNDSALATAFGLLCVQYPALRGNVRHDGYGHVLDATVGHRAEFRPSWTECDGYPRDVAGGWDVTRSLSTLAVTRMRDRIRVALYLDHCVGDGRHLYALSEALWQHYADLAIGSKIALPAPRPLPSPPLTVLADRIGTTRTEPTSTSPVDASLADLRHRRVLLTRTETAALVAFGRSNGVSVYGLLSAAVVTAQRDLLTTRAPTTIWSVIDLRNRVDPPVGPTETTNFGSAKIVELGLSTGDGLIPVARAVQDQILAALAAEEPQRSVLDDSVGQSMSHSRPNLAGAIVSNLGVVPELVTPPGLDVVDFRIWPYGWRHPYPMYMASTYAGRLGLDMVFRADVHADDQADTLAGLVAGMLTGTLRMAGT